MGQAAVLQGNNWNKNVFPLDRKRLQLGLLTADYAFVKITIVKAHNSTDLKFEITVLEFLVAAIFASGKATVITH